MATNSDGLCSVCANIDLKEYFRREIHAQWIIGGIVGPSQDAIRLGYLEDIEKRCESCVFCRLIIEALCKRWAPSKDVTLQELLNLYHTDETKKECYLFSYLYADNSGSNAALVDSLSKEKDSQRAYRIRIGVGAPEDEIAPIIYQVGNIQLSAISTAQHGLDSVMVGFSILSAQIWVWPGIG